MLECRNSTGSRDLTRGLEVRPRDSHARTFSSPSYEPCGSTGLHVRSEAAPEGCSGAGQALLAHWQRGLLLAGRLATLMQTLSGSRTQNVTTCSILCDNIDRAAATAGRPEARPNAGPVNSRHQQSMLLAVRAWPTGHKRHCWSAGSWVRADCGKGATCSASIPM